MTYFGYSIVNVQLALGYALALGIVTGFFVYMVRFLVFSGVER